MDSQILIYILLGKYNKLNDNTITIKGQNYNINEFIKGFSEIIKKLEEHEKNIYSQFGISIEYEIL